MCDTSPYSWPQLRLSQVQLWHVQSLKRQVQLRIDETLQRAFAHHASCAILFQKAEYVTLYEDITPSYHTTSHLLK